MYLTSPDLQKLPYVSHGFFTRNGGVSEGLHASLNCGRGSSDIPERVEENRRRVADALGATPEKLMSLYQIHSNMVVTVESCWRATELPRADAMVTNQAGIALGILTADCVPILLADTKQRVIGAVHAGWKGALGGVIEATAHAMFKLGATPDTLLASIGPAIGKRSYEVGDEFYRQFLTHDPAFASLFIPSSKPLHWLFDIKQFAFSRLAATGITTINLLENDTYLEEDNFFSFRRTTHRSEPDYGRQLSGIMLT